MNARQKITQLEKELEELKAILPPVLVKVKGNPQRILKRSNLDVPKHAWTKQEKYWVSAIPLIEVEDL
jgi:hypothetical protein